MQQVMGQCRNLCNLVLREKSPVVPSNFKVLNELVDRKDLVNKII